MSMEMWWNDNEGENQTKVKRERVRDSRNGGKSDSLYICLFVFGATAPLPSHQLARASSFTRFLDHTQRLTTVGRTPLDE
jgi:hypothetical protein